MGLFTQEITVGLSNAAYVIEKVTLPQIKKSNVDFTVQPGTVALVGKQKFKGQSAPYKLLASAFGEKNACCDVFLYPDKQFDNITINFFGGQHEICLSALQMAKAKFAIVGSASIEIGDYKDLAAYFNRSVTKQDVVDEVNKNYRVHLTNEVSAAASKYITPETTEVRLQALLNTIASDVMANSRKTSSMLFNMGLLISQRGVSMHLNALDDADEKFKILNDALIKNALESLDKDKLDREERERQAERQHEIDQIRAENTTREESDATKTINTNTNGKAPVVIKEGGEAKAKKRFCTECGKELTSASGKFCPNCGAKVTK